jgi:hypothetical protein
MQPALFSKDISGSIFRTEVYILHILVNNVKYICSIPVDIIRVIKSKRISWTGHVARMGDRRGAYRVLVGRPEGKRLLRRPKRR